jgi:hypothetical protein
MEHSKMNEGIPVPKKKSNANTVPIRVRKITARSIRTILNNLNKKPLGKRIIVDDLISKAITLLSESEFNELREASYSSSDRLDIQYQEYCRSNGTISKEKFLEILLQAGLPKLNQNNSDSE